jgi:hypothetical protein
MEIRNITELAAEFRTDRDVVRALIRSHGLRGVQKGKSTLFYGPALTQIRAILRVATRPVETVEKAS